MPPSRRRELKKEAGIPDKVPFITPTFSGNMEHVQDESLMLFSYSWHNGKRYRLFYGVGTVYRVVKGDKQDLVYVNFGLFRGHNTRLVVVYDNQARRQIMTLKRGQVCHIYGLCRYFTTDIKIKGKDAKGLRLGLYARAIQGWYVPSMLDLKKMPNDEIAEPTDNELKAQATFEEVLEDFFNGKGNEQDEYE